MAEELISREEASRQVRSMIFRTALLHYAFTRTLMDELGEEKGKELTKKAIALYGRRIGQRALEKAREKGLANLPEDFQNDLPPLGWPHREKVETEGEPRTRLFTCYLAEAWKELGVPEIGRLYCFVDQAKYEAFNPELEFIHAQNLLDGDPCCEMVVGWKKKR